MTGHPKKGVPAAPFVPSDFLVPRSLEMAGLRLEPLGTEHNERDHAAWMSSIDHIHATPGFDRSEREWPVEMPLEQNLPGFPVAAQPEYVIFFAPGAVDGGVQSHRHLSGEWFQLIAWI